MDPPEIEHRLRELVASISPQVRPILLQVLTADEERRAEEIGNLYAAGVMPSTAELLIDAEADPTLRAVLVGMLREAGC